MEQDHSLISLTFSLIKMVCQNQTLLLHVMFNILVPGIVSNFTISPKFTEVMFTWSIPERPNGVIINYEINYNTSQNVTISVENTTNLSTKFIVSGLDPGSHVSDISVRAYTISGPGEATNETNVTTFQVPCKRALQ